MTDSGGFGGGYGGGIQGGQPSGGSDSYGAVFGPSAAVDVLSAGAGQTAAAPARPRRRRRGVVSAVLAAALLLAGGAGYAAWSALSGGGPQPEQVLPADTLAFAKIDLDPSAGQKIALFRLLQRFPKAAGLSPSDKDFGEWVLRRLSEQGGAGSLDFTRDIEPWLGKRVAFAAVPSAGVGGVATLVVLAETDQQKAAAAMGKLRDREGGNLGFAFMNGFVVVSPGSRTAAQDAVDAAARSPLSANPQFVSDVDSLHSDQVVTAWVDAGRAGALLRQSLATLAGAGPAGVSSLLGPAWQGRMVLGVHAGDGMLELQGKSFGATAQPTIPPITGLDAAPPDAFAVLAVAGANRRVADTWRQLAALPQYHALLAQARALGIALPGDLETLVGSQLVVSLGGHLGAAPSILAASTSSDPAAAKAVLDRMLRAAGPNAPQPATSIRGRTLYVGSSPAVVAAAGHGTLASSDLFSRAVADPSSAQALVFVDLDQVWSALRGSQTTVADQEVEQIAAVGLSASSSGTTSSVTLRIVLR
jgi:Protein of unknown function (DUF3352)